MKRTISSSASSPPPPNQPQQEQATGDPVGGKVPDPSPPSSSNSSSNQQQQQQQQQQPHQQTELPPNTPQYPPPPPPLGEKPPEEHPSIPGEKKPPSSPPLPGEGDNQPQPPPEEGIEGGINGRHGGAGKTGAGGGVGEKGRQVKPSDFIKGELKGGSPGGGLPNSSQNLALALLLFFLVLFLLNNFRTEGQKLSFSDFKHILLERHFEDIDFLKVLGGSRIYVYFHDPNFHVWIADELNQLSSTSPSSTSTPPPQQEQQEQQEQQPSGVPASSPTTQSSNGKRKKKKAQYFVDVPQDTPVSSIVDEARRFKGVPPERTIRVDFLPEKDFTLLLNGLIIIVISAAIVFLARGVKSSSVFTMGMGSSRAQVIKPDQLKTKTTFNDVAGMKEAKREIMEFVSFLKEPTQFTKLGAKVPRGALLLGPPGTGKTLLAKAVAGESGVPFISASGSEFVEMFVGVGPSRVRDIFKKARENKPCIIYIDEIDAIGRPRGKGGSFSRNDETENTLNQLLVEMDGFSTTSDVIILASTNMPVDELDRALLRPGRFDRQIHIDNPDISDRVEIFMVHLRPILLATELTRETVAERMSALTPGFSGADIMNVCNEAALIAARYDSEGVEMKHFEQALDRVVGGLERRSKVMSSQEKQIIAFHEAGRALVGWFCVHCDPLLKITIVPRGTNTLGYAQFYPKEQFINTLEQLEDKMCSILGGRAAQKIIFGEASTGGYEDLNRATQMAYMQISQFGMSTELGPVSYPIPSSSEASIQKPYSEATAAKFDREARKIVEQVYQRAESMLRERLPQLRKVAEFLLEHEIMNQKQFEEIVGPRPEGASQIQFAAGSS